MQRKPTKNTRGPSAEEKRFHGYTKESDCIQCGNEGPSIVDHVAGATFKHNKVLIGHWFVIPLCVECDTVKTQGSSRKFVETFGKTIASLWEQHILCYGIDKAPDDVFTSIMDSGK
jgi:hypothetical protein